MTGFRIVGIVLALVGVVATIFPEWFAPLTRATEPTLDVFEAVERRVRGGMIFAVGLIFLVVTALRPWGTSVPTAIFCFVSGALAARLFGMAVHGAVPKQWMWVGAEAAIIAVVTFWLSRSSGPAA